MDLTLVQDHLVVLDYLLQNAGQRLRMLEQTVCTIKEQSSTIIQQDNEIKAGLIDLNRAVASAGLEVRKVWENETAIQVDLAEIRKMVEAWER
ncbi:hypothetical protein [Haliscomenobacter sp.]|uniref:hypothetical protein n=1 Tax=Haliscomenobacter sp. TaxID=2717303 RepID=UPI003BAB4168